MIDIMKDMIDSRAEARRLIVKCGRLTIIMAVIVMAPMKANKIKARTEVAYEELSRLLGCYLGTSAAPSAAPMASHSACFSLSGAWAMAGSPMWRPPVLSLGEQSRRRVVCRAFD